MDNKVNVRWGALLTLTGVLFAIAPVTYANAAASSVPPQCNPDSQTAPPWSSEQPSLAATRHYREWRETTTTLCIKITDRNIEKYNKIVDPQTRKQSGHGRHTVGWTPGLHTLYRADDRPPSVIFDEGFVPYDSGEDANLALNPGIGVQNSGLVSTAWNPSFAASFHGHPYVYVVRADGGWYRYDDNEESEVAFPGGIRKERIVGVLKKTNRGGYTWESNVKYQEPEVDDDNGDFADMASDDPVYLDGQFPATGSTQVFTPVSVPGWTIEDSSPKLLRNGSEVFKANTPVTPPSNGPADANVYRTYYSNAGTISAWQTIPTVAGRKYAVDYDVADGNVTGITPALTGKTKVGALSVEVVDGPFWSFSQEHPLATQNTPWQLLEGSAGTGPADIQWKGQTLVFTALSGLTTISFQRSRISDNNSILLADIAINPVD